MYLEVNYYSKNEYSVDYYVNDLYINIQMNSANYCFSQSI